MTPEEQKDSAADDVGRLLQLAGPRERSGEDREARVRAASREVWRASVRDRTLRRWMWRGSAALAAAATIVFAVWLRRGSPAAVPIDTRPAVVAHVTASASRNVNVGASVRAGDAIRTDNGERASLALNDGGEIRLGAATSIRLSADRIVTLDTGLIFVDSGADKRTISVDTPLGRVNDVGTRFEVRVDVSALRIRVRDGEVRVARGDSIHAVPSGRELSVMTSGSVESRVISPADPEWAWATLAGPVFRVEGATLASFVDWAGREGGWTMTFSDSALATSVGGVVLHGSIEGLSADEALRVVLPTCGLTFKTTGTRVVISKQGSGGEE